ncbi:MAG TPA: hypothetical protein VIH99_10230 [Bdellovibrionota bacterium]|jgi:hypothetical protein
MGMGKRYFQTAVFLAVALILSPGALATRVVNFSASGQNVLLGNTVGSTMTPSGCSITINNNSPSGVKQVVQMEVVLTDSKWGATATQTMSSTWTMTSAGVVVGDCAVTSSSCTKDYTFFSLTAGTTDSQDVSCSGFIKVDDFATGTPGFITASGALTTYQEAPRALGNTTSTIVGSNRNAITTPTVAPIVIGEGRAF